jgi:hypothetical protein
MKKFLKSGAKWNIWAFLVYEFVSLGTQINVRVDVI